MNAKKVLLRERAQVMVIFAVVLVALLGLAAIAIDGGMLFSDRRYAQDAADAAAMAGGGMVAKFFNTDHAHYSFINFSCPSTAALRSNSMDAAAVSAASNHFTIAPADLTLANMGVEVLCTDTYTEKYLDMHVKITTQTKTSFVQLFYGGPLKSTVEAIVRIHPITPIAFGNAVVSLNPNCGQDGLYFNGNTNTIVSGGGVWSEGHIGKSGEAGDIYANPNPDDPQALIPQISYYKDCPAPTHPDTFHPGAVPAANRLNITWQPNYDCTTPPNRGDATTSSSQPLQPGRYGNINGNGGNLTFDPGLYCISSGMSLYNGTTHLAQGGDLNPYYGVTFIITGGGVQIGPNEFANLLAPSVDAPFGGIPGLLMYFPPSNSSGILDFQGNGQDAKLQGTLYHPTGLINLHGNPGLSPNGSTEFIGWNVDVKGSTNININYNGEGIVQSPSRLDMQR